MTFRNLEDQIGNSTSEECIEAFGMLWDNLTDDQLQEIILCKASSELKDNLFIELDNEL